MVNDTVFKAQLIEDKDYFGLKQQAVILSIFAGFGIGILTNIIVVPNSWAILLGGIAIVILIFQGKINYRLGQILTNRKLEIRTDSIRILGKDKSVNEMISVGELDSIVIPPEFEMPEESLADVLNIMKGKIRSNYLILNQNGADRRLEFQMDSYYMIEQIKKIINHWKQSGTHVIVAG